MTVIEQSKISYCNKHKVTKGNLYVRKKRMKTNKLINLNPTAPFSCALAIIGTNWFGTNF